MQKRNIVALSIFVVFYVFFGVYITLNQEQIVYHPFQQDFESCPSFVQAEKVVHQGTRMYVSAESEQPTVVLYHGNAGSACDRYFYANLFSQAGLGYIIVEYAGFSNDPQVATHDLLKKDAEHVISYLNEQGLDKVFVVGESIGTGVATHHVSLLPPERLLLISPFTNLSDIASNRFWFYPTTWMVDNAFDNTIALQNFNNKVSIIHGKSDSIIPHKLGEKLFNSIQSAKTFVTIDGAGHNDLFQYQETFSAIHTFLIEE